MVVTISLSIYFFKIDNSLILYLLFCLPNLLFAAMTIEERLKLKLYELIYPSGVSHLNETNSIYLGTTKLKDIPENVDEFFRLWFIKFNKKTKLFLGLRDLVEARLRNERFVSFAEYETIFRDKSISDASTTQSRYPVYRLLNITSDSQRQRFVNAYPNSLKGYFSLMKQKNLELHQLYNQTHHIRLPNDQREKHTYVVGGTGSGKSELLKHLILQDIGKQNKCVILIEPNGDLSEQVARQQGIPPERLIYIDCSFPPRTPLINPFELIRSQNDLEIETQAQTIRTALMQIFDSDGQPLTLQMQSVIEPCLEIIAKKRGTLKDLQRFMVSGLNEDLVAFGKTLVKHKDFFERKFDESNLAVSRQGIYQKLMNVLNMSAFTDFFCGETSINLRKAIEDKKVIIFNLSKGKLGDFTATYIGKMIVAILQNIIFQRANIKQENRTPIGLYIDEFQDFINPSIEQIFVQGRKYNVGLTVASQVVGQKMTTEMTKIVLGNTNVKFVGMNGYETLRAMSKETFTEIEELKNLSVGEFFCRIGNANGFVLKVPEKHLGWKTCISEQDWKTVLTEQLNRYYRPRVRLQPQNKNAPTLPKNSVEQDKIIEQTPKQEGLINNNPNRDGRKKDKFKPKYGGG